MLVGNLKTLKLLIEKYGNMKVAEVIQILLKGGNQPLI